MKKMIGILIIVSLVITAVYLHFTDKQNSVAGNSPGDSATDFELQALDSTQTSLSSYKGKPIILNFWASWCEPCENEMPELEKFHTEYSEEVVVMGVNITSQEISEQSVRNFVNDLDISFPILLDTEGVFRHYQVLNLPTTYFIDSNGKIVDSYPGELTFEILEKYKAKLK
ncbi:TlpA disulfide reductase family protein [Bacillus sp. RO1]|uniref:TlpA disulfide reductase family protein n=1 Tax=Bacillus sp. RO1 TaxID=2722703 RepID=UPI0014566A3C|nr:TlpA disulfide reductase family protein [Bacillus sp. RO1]NLP52023.1 TlpA family protein disulfide reductase [Bacillus sp. RO1]